MPTIHEAADAWIRNAHAQLANGGLTVADLEALRRTLQQAMPRQRLLYLHTRDPSLYSSVIGMALHEPVAGCKDTLRTRDDWPYATVHEAVVDGWRVIQFPNLMAPYDDRELDYVGFEFILEKEEMLIHD